MKFSGWVFNPFVVIGEIAKMLRLLIVTEISSNFSDVILKETKGWS
jgi:hypothetical protein